MSDAAAVLSVVVGAFFLFAGVIKLSGIAPVRDRAAGLGLPFERYRLFGVAEVPVGVGLLVGLLMPGLALAAALVLTFLMLGLVGLHVRAGSRVSRVAQPVALSAAAITLAVLLIAT